MKGKLSIICCVLIYLLIAHNAVAATVLDETGFIFGFSGETYSFVADQTPLIYEVTLTDFEFPAAFDFLGVAITTSTDNVTELLSPGMATFFPEFDTTYFVNVLGRAADPVGAGLFGINITSVPIPPSALMFSSGFLGLVLLWRKRR